MRGNVPATRGSKCLAIVAASSASSESDALRAAAGPATSSTNAAQAIDTRAAGLHIRGVAYRPPQRRTGLEFIPTERPW